MTAWCCLFCDGPIAGKTVLVTGAPARSGITRCSSQNGAARG